MDEEGEDRVMKSLARLVALLLSQGIALQAAEFHVATSATASDSNDGAPNAPLRTIQRAAELAQPGDVITVHAGVYRERVNPPRGGTSDDKRITYQAAPGEHVEIKGSEVVTGWTKDRPGVWKVTLPAAFFGSFNPYSDLIHGNWFQPNGREHHTGAVYLNGDWLAEAAKLDEVMKPAGKTPLWFGKVEGGRTTLWAQFGDADPNSQRIEINVRQTVFYPDRPGRNYITVRGFTLCQAATPWAPPTAEQIGLVGTHWSKGWIIENNTISHSVCSGISLGKYGDRFDNTGGNTAAGYVKTVQRALTNEIPWTKEAIGHHVVRNNVVSHCEQAGIVGSLGCAFSTVTGNVVHDIHVRRLFTGAEMAGIKFHGAIDTEIRGNHVYRAYRGLWLDWMAQGARVSRNLFHENTADDLMMEVDHGPYVLDNNVFLSRRNIWDWSEGGAYVNNLFAGQVVPVTDSSRATPFHPAHSTAIAGMKNIQSGDDRFYNNIFIGNALPAQPAKAGDKAPPNHGGLEAYDRMTAPVFAGGNVYYGEAIPCRQETKPLVLADKQPVIKLEQQGDQWLLHCDFGPELKCANTTLVTSSMLGKASIPDVAFENPDGSAFEIAANYFGKERNKTNPAPGPFETGDGTQVIKVWPK